MSNQSTTGSALLETLKKKMMAVKSDLEMANERNDELKRVYDTEKASRDKVSARFLTLFFRVSLSLIGVLRWNNP